MRVQTLVLVLALLVVGLVFFYARVAPPVAAGPLRVHTVARFAGAAAAAARRVVVVGDLHGDVVNAVAVLRMAGVVAVEEQGQQVHWHVTEPPTTLVQLGDLLDRGPDSRDVLDLIMSLQEEASREGGEVLVALGNHEVMNLLGTLRYVHKDDTKKFGGAKTREFALSALGVYGAWIRDRMSAIVVVEGNVMAHAGVLPAVARLGVPKVNNLVRKMLWEGEEGDTYRQFKWLLGSAGPMWTREEAKGNCTLVWEALRILNATRMIVGHTVQKALHLLCVFDWWGYHQRNLFIGNPGRIASGTVWWCTVAR
eukprot:TRINITY_DN2064_c0_g1_i3.p1 TRINITY_DN2064_c0_g1~~TRINITY_DN2064_c0_g1_i3.p1  ORF type:complete len:310 (+),score=72.32 TRINITY_DN2064_c0_g1_i3:38-967(+)